MKRLISCLLLLLAHSASATVVIDVYGAVPVIGGTPSYPLYMAFPGDGVAHVEFDSSRSTRASTDSRELWAVNGGDDSLAVLEAFGTSYTNDFTGAGSLLLVRDLFTDGSTTVWLIWNTPEGFTVWLRQWVQTVYDRRALLRPLQYAAAALRKGKEKQALLYLRLFKHNLQRARNIAPEYKVRFNSFMDNIVAHLHAE